MPPLFFLYTLCICVCICTSVLTCTYVHRCIDLYVRTWLHVELNKHVIVGGWFNTFIFLISVNDSMEISVHRNGTYIERE